MSLCHVRAQVGRVYGKRYTTFPNLEVLVQSNLEHGTALFPLLLKLRHVFPHLRVVPGHRPDGLLPGLGGRRGDPARQRVALHQQQVAQVQGGGGQRAGHLDRLPLVGGGGGGGRPEDLVHVQRHGEPVLAAVAARVVDFLIAIS